MPFHLICHINMNIYLSPIINHKIEIIMNHLLLRLLLLCRIYYMFFHQVHKYFDITFILEDESDIHNYVFIHLISKFLIFGESNYGHGFMFSSRNCSKQFNSANFWLTLSIDFMRTNYVFLNDDIGCKIQTQTMRRNDSLRWWTIEII